MRAQRAFDLEWRDVDATDLQHVRRGGRNRRKNRPGLRYICRPSGSILPERSRDCSRIVPIHDGAGGPAHLQFADLALLHRLAGLTHEPDVIAGDCLPVVPYLTSPGRFDRNRLARAPQAGERDPARPLGGVLRVSISSAIPGSSDIGIRPSRSMM
jgi:hypothetical protein